MLELNHIYHGNSLDILKEFPNSYFDCCVTSPPYFSLRNYGTPPLIWDGEYGCKHIFGSELNKSMSGGHGYKQDTSKGSWFESSSSFCSYCGAWLGSLGLEPTFDMYISHLMQIMNQVYRVLKPTGTCWVNIGDSYGGSNSGETEDSKASAYGSGATCIGAHRPSQYAVPKSLCQIPSRFSIAMTDSNWILRNEIIWHKPNSMVSPVKDRFTVDFEKVFFFTKSQHYYFNQQLEKSYWAEFDKRSLVVGGVRHKSGKSVDGEYASDGVGYSENGMRNKRCVWSICTKPSDDPHYAMFPEELVEPMLSAGCPVGGVVLDPFSGMGTTSKVANRMGMHFVGIDLNEEYVNGVKI